MVASNNSGWLQIAFGILMVLFDQVGLKMNVQETVGVVCHPYRADGAWAYESYTRRMTVSGRS